MRDPRRHRRYATAARAFIASHEPGTACALCGEPVDTRLPGTIPDGPTVEHRLPIRTILATAQTQAEALALACDTSLWGVAHRRCQSRQGGEVTNGRAVVVYEPSRDW
jgi:hypothetical protein